MLRTFFTPILLDGSVTKQSLNTVVIQFSILLSVLMLCFSSAVQERWGGNVPSQRQNLWVVVKKTKQKTPTVYHYEEEQAEFLSRHLDKIKGTKELHYKTLLNILRQRCKKGLSEFPCIFNYYFISLYCLSFLFRFSEYWV